MKRSRRRLLEQRHRRALAAEAAKAGAVERLVSIDFDRQFASIAMVGFDADAFKVVMAAHDRATGQEGKVLEPFDAEDRAWIRAEARRREREAERNRCRGRCRC